MTTSGLATVTVADAAAVDRQFLVISMAGAGNLAGNLAWAHALLGADLANLATTSNGAPMSVTQGGQTVTVKGPSTAPVATDPAMVTTESPNSAAVAALNSVTAAIVAGGVTPAQLRILGTPIIADSGNKANAAAVATLAAAAGKTTYLTDFLISASGATAGLPVTVTVTGLLGGTKNFTFVFPAGVLVGASPLHFTPPQPLPASAPNTAIVITLPASGAGGTNATVTADGFQL